jgi:two-component system cell cycle response regulator
MNSSSNPWRPDFGARIDAIEGALRGLAGSDPDAENTLRALARSVSEQATNESLSALRDAADRVASASSNALIRQARPLITLLRDAAGAQRPEGKVLVIGGDSDFAHAIESHMPALDGIVLHAANGAEARLLLKERSIVAVVLHVVLADSDGRALLHRLRESPTTAALPVLLLAERVDESLREDRILHTSVDHLSTPRDTAAIARWILSRLRRAPESAKAARRDNVTGHLNRAAFHETFEATQRLCTQAGEPLSFAILCLDSLRDTLDSMEASSREEVLQTAGLILSRSLRTTDIVARWGLYEFAMLFPGEESRGAHRAVEKVIGKLQEQPILLPGGTPLRLNVSAGVTLVATGDSMDNVITEADHLVFQAIARGGNQIVVGGDEDPSPRKPRVLLLIRDVVTTQVLAQLLEKDHVDVISVDHWEPDMAPDINKQHFHLVVIDETLPPDGGIAALKVLRSDTRNSRLPIIMLVSGTSGDVVAQSLEVGANDYVVRPFSPFAFLSRVHRLLSRGAGEGAVGISAARLLVVSEDVKTLVLVASALNQRGGFDVLLAKGAKDGLDRLQAEAPDAVLVDMPLAPLGTQAFMDLLTERTNRSPVDIVVAEPIGSTPAELPPGVRGRIAKPISPLSIAADLERALALSPSNRRRDDASERLNAEIRRVMRPTP